MFELLQRFYSSFFTFIEISTLVFFPEDESPIEDDKSINKSKVDIDTDNLSLHEYIENIVNKNIHKILDEDFDEMDNKVILGLEDIDDKIEILNTRLNLLEKKVKKLTDLIKIKNVIEIENKSDENKNYENIKSYQDLTHPLNWQDEYITTDCFEESNLIDINISDNIKDNNYELLMRAYTISFDTNENDDDNLNNDIANDNENDDDNDNENDDDNDNENDDDIANDIANDNDNVETFEQEVEVY